MCDENPKLKEKPGKSTADKRLLDSESWYVSEYDDDGNCVLQRGTISPLYIDQFSLWEQLESKTNENDTKVETTSSVYPRSREVREQALLRAKGHCEYCGAKGFITKAGSIYLESHHIVPLSEGGMI